MIRELKSLLSMAVKFGVIIVICYWISLGLVVSTESADTEFPLTPNRYVLKSECLRELNYQINSELHASLVYMNMGAYFNGNKIARKGFAKFFTQQSHDEKEHAQKLMDYLNVRGGKVETLDVKMPERNTWDSVRDALETALTLENNFNDYFHKIHSIAEHTCQDVHLMDFLEAEFFSEQVSSINQITRILTMLNQMDSGIGEYLLDRQVLEGKITPEDL